MQRLIINAGQVPEDLGKRLPSVKEVVVKSAEFEDLTRLESLSSLQALGVMVKHGASCRSVQMVKTNGLNVLIIDTMCLICRGAVLYAPSEVGSKNLYIFDTLTTLTRVDLHIDRVRGCTDLCFTRSDNFRALSSLRSLARLTVTWCDMGDETWKPCLEYSVLTGLSRLTGLKVTDYAADMTELCHICALEITSPVLTLDWNFIGALSSVMELRLKTLTRNESFRISLLHNFPTLTCLCLMTLELSKQDWQTLSEMTKLCKLKLTTEEIPSRVEHLTNLTRLTSLYLARIGSQYYLSQAKDPDVPYLPWYACFARMKKLRKLRIRDDNSALYFLNFPRKDVVARNLRWIKADQMIFPYN